MARLSTIKPRVATASASRVQASTTTERRMTGRRLQARRLRIWSQDPTCADCGRLTHYPAGFELDHKVPLHQGGQDTDDNCQILCVHIEDGVDAGCHAKKTAREAPRA